jgi:large subunit ribosomal protein L21
VDVGETVEITDVLFVSGNGDTTVGAPNVAGARVLAEVVEHGRDDKILGFKYKNKTRYRRKFGHRQDYTRLSIKDILVGGAKPKTAEPKSKPKPASRKKAAAEDGAAAAPVSPEAGTEGPDEAVAEAKPAPKPARKATSKPTGEAKPRTRTTRKAAPEASDEGKTEE